MEDQLSHENSPISSPSTSSPPSPLPANISPPVIAGPADVSDHKQDPPTISINEEEAQMAMLLTEYFQEQRKVYEVQVTIISYVNSINTMCMLSHCNEQIYTCLHKFSQTKCYL